MGSSGPGGKSLSRQSAVEGFWKYLRLDTRRGVLATYLYRVSETDDGDGRFTQPSIQHPTTIRHKEGREHQKSWRM